MKRLWAACLAALMLGPALGGRSIGQESGASSSYPDPQVSFLLILRADSFLCAPCLDRILAGITGLRRKYDRVPFWSVVLYAPAEAGPDADAYRSVVTRRAESVLRANGLAGPLVVDEARAWQEACPQSAALLVLDGGNRRARRFPVPLTPETLEDLAGIINDGGGHDSNRDRS